MASKIDVRQARAGDFEAVAAAYAAASVDEAVNAWVMAAGGLPPGLFEGHLADFVAKAIEEDEVWIASSGGEVWGVAVWIAVHSIDRFETEAAAMAAAAAEHGLPALERAASVAHLVARTHPRRFPHLYLHSIATVPEHRGGGAGTALLAERLRPATGAGMPVYLEASTDDSLRLYERLGFVPEGERIALPEGGPVLVPMWRR